MPSQGQGSHIYSGDYPPIYVPVIAMFGVIVWRSTFQPTWSLAHARHEKLVDTATIQIDDFD